MSTSPTLPGRFSDRRALVVGGSTGIGLAVVRRLAGEGARLVVADLDAETSAAVATSLSGPGHVGLGVDVTSTDSVQEVVAQLDGLDVLVHVAGGDRGHPAFLEAGDEIWTGLLELNLVGVVRTCRATAPMLASSAGGGAIVVVGSVNSVLGLGSEAYSAAKAGVTSLVTNLAVDLAPRVRVNAVLPGTIRTRVWDDQPGGADRMLPLYPLGRVGEPDDVAGAVAFLASADASWITGHALPVDGGLLTGGALRRLVAEG